MKLVLSAILIALTTGCAGNKAPAIVGQSGLVISASIDKVSAAVESLTAQNIIAPQVSLVIQQRLQAANTRLVPLPGLLRTIEKMQDADASPTTQVDQAIAILSIVGQDISISIAGVPVSESTKTLIELIRATTSLIQTTLVEVAEIKGAQ